MDVLTAGPADANTLAAMLGRAFDDDPVSTYIFPADSRRRRGLPRFFGLQLRKVFLPGGHVYTDADRATAALWQAPDGPKVSAVSQLVNLAPLVPVIGTRLPAALRLLSAIESRHPRRPHWYLGVLGTDPDHQGKGKGSAVLEPVLRRCDTSGEAAYLESSKEGNVPFYERHGFKVTEELTVPGGPTLWLMWRDPRPPEEE